MDASSSLGCTLAGSGASAHRGCPHSEWQRSGRVVGDLRMGLGCSRRMAIDPMPVKGALRVGNP